MRLRFFFVFILLAVPGMPVLWAHPIHVSVCEMAHKPESDELVITIKIFADDFQDVLEDRTGKSINLGQPGEHKKTDEYILEYLREKLLIDINGKPATLEFDRKEIEDIATWCYIYVRQVPDIREITIRNLVMLHWFNDQVNVVHLDCNGKMNSTFFSRGRERDVFRF